MSTIPRDRTGGPLTRERTGGPLTMESCRYSTVPQNICFSVQSAGSSRKLSLQRNRRRPQDIKMEKDCCKIGILLTAMQIGIGQTLAVLGIILYAETSLPLNDTPFWAGIPLILAGATGVYVVWTKRHISARKHCRDVIYTIAVTFSAISVCVALAGAISTGIHSHMITEQIRVRNCTVVAEGVEAGCKCAEAAARRIVKGISDCEVKEIRDQLILMCAFCLTGAFVSFWLAGLLLSWHLRTPNRPKSIRAPKFFSRYSTRRLFKQAVERKRPASLSIEDPESPQRD